MGKYNFDHVIERRGTACQKWDNLGKVFGDPDILALWKADMDFKAPPEVIERLKKRLDHGIFGYPNRPDDFYDAIISWMSRRHGWDIKKEWICHSPGVTPSLVFSMLAMTRPGDRVVIQSPIYAPFYHIIEENGRRITDNPLVLDNGRFFMNLDDLKAKLNSRVKMLFLCNPHNPSGRVWQKRELEEIAEICLKNNITIVSDDVHSDIVYEGNKHIPIASISRDIEERTITSFSPSKTFNLAGFRSAVVVIPNKDLRDRYNDLISGMHLAGVTVFGAEAIAAAYSTGEEWLEELIEYLSGNLRFVEEFLRENIPAIKLIKPEGTYVPLIDFRELGLSSEELQKFLVHKAGVGMNNGAEFGKVTEGFARMTIAAPRSTITEGLNRIKTAIENR
ncbi:MAG: PatB family C-S lyase [Aminobacterium sp.]|jgi:cystathionine beta-lyase|uniref:MalY/PatB family protein n=1 Tax=Aminobacterium sp. MB27-C1 TaxID=3070661 RepID=UPI001BCF1CF7|nr:PatB family C-S lyase [Aminobacterium sp. MB27-C1]MDD2207728.1 PatB family C-S lyase [Aminobacterium sp.]MDD3426895.1 PatB family C-S lyase [Aminobacterium sp.]MDD4229768.1 PatB family C-S lyase [Aminobacterium sp.]MDD4552548.1 PatB family C-S lyase [Aminobacterium sp.]WMI72176.1 PatB family C-S lyase [Aminobacterium sp. MB27-C1]